MPGHSRSLSLSFPNPRTAAVLKSPNPVVLSAAKACPERSRRGPHACLRGHLSSQGVSITARFLIWLEFVSSLLHATGILPTPLTIPLAKKQLAPCRKLDAKSGRRKPHTRRSKNVKICISCTCRSFFLELRYLFCWFGFKATEYTCANLKIKGDQFHESICSQGEVYVSTQWTRSTPRALRTPILSRLRQRQQRH